MQKAKAKEFVCRTTDGQSAGVSWAQVLIACWQWTCTRGSAWAILTFQSTMSMATRSSWTTLPLSASAPETWCANPRVSLHLSLGCHAVGGTLLARKVVPVAQSVTTGVESPQPGRLAGAVQTGESCVVFTTLSALPIARVGWRLCVTPEEACNRGH